MNGLLSGVFIRRFLQEMGLSMRRLFPSRVEVAIFATLALICAALVVDFKPGVHDLGFAALAGPIFLIACCMGLRRSPVWTRAEAEESDDQ